MAAHLPDVIGERVRAAVAAHAFTVDDAPQPLTVSVGLAEFPLVRDRRGRLGWESAVELAARAAEQAAADGGPAIAAVLATDIDAALGTPA